MDYNDDALPPIRFERTLIASIHRYIHIERAEARPSISERKKYRANVENIFNKQKEFDLR